jgi:outer membrane protein assembly factor BamB
MLGPRSIHARLAVFLAAAALALPAAAQSLRFDLSGDVTLDEVDAVVRGHLQRAEVLTANGRWDEVIETLRQVTDNRGDRVIAVVPGYYVRLRDYCHQRLAALPPEALAIYREQVDAQAEEWFAAALEAENEHREAGLRKIVDQFFCSSRGDDALRLLGEFALERGDYGAARGYWEQLLETPPAVVKAADYAALEAAGDVTEDDRALLRRYYVKLARDGNELYVLHTRRSIDPELPRLTELMRRRGFVGPRLAYPRGELSPADAYARLILVSILEGSHAWAEAGIQDLTAAYPDARGRMGGRDVVYADALKALLAESRSWPLRTDGADWPTFAGNEARNRVQPIDFDVGRVRWRVPLAPIAAGDFDYPSRRTAEDRRALLSYLPIVVDGKVFVADSTKIRGYDLATGEPAWGNDPVVYDRGDQTEADPTFPARATLGAPRYTLTAHQGKLCARMGRPVTSTLVDGVFRGPMSSIVCLDLAAEGKLHWSKMPPAEDRWAFEGSPIADDDFVYVALRKGGVRPQAHVECRDAETGDVVWRRLICSADTAAQNNYDEITHNLLTLVGDTIYFNTNLGAVAALSKFDGEIRWITTYPRATSSDLNLRTTHFFRDLTPCVYDRGTVFVAPADSRHLLALDASCGLLRWETTLAEDAVHLLGVADDFLLASGERQWWIHSLSGRVAHVWPDESPKGFGRGAIVRDVVLRPTRATIDVLGVPDARRLREIELTTRGAGGGHLIAVEGSLIIASGDELIVLDRHGGASAPEKQGSAPAATPGASLRKLTINPRVDE